MTNVQLLRERFNEIRAIHDACVAQAHGTRRANLVTQGWLTEVALSIALLERQIVELEHASAPPPPELLRRAERRYDAILAALTPANAAPAFWRSGGADKRALPVAAGAAVDDTARTSPTIDLRPVVNRLTLVHVFLFVQIAAAAALLVYSVGMFMRFDPFTSLTRQQWAARAPARANLERLRHAIQDAMQAPDPAPAAPPQPSQQPAAAVRPASTVPASSATPVVDEPLPSHGDDDPRRAWVRGEVEATLAALGQLPLASTDLRLANAWLDNLLAGLDADVVNYRRLLELVSDLESAFGRIQGEEPPSSIWILALGSLLGVVTITAHLNWKFRNRWDTAGFIPWYVAKLVAAPAITLAAAGFLSQVRFTFDASGATGATGAADVSNLGLIGTSPLLLFGIAVATGLGSNRMFDWLKGMATQVTGAAGARPSGETPRTNTPPRSSADEPPEQG
jgi:hypothetical protein